MIVHLFEDQKFVDTTIDNFENESYGLNKYIVFSNNQELKYISRKEKVLILSNSSYKLELDFIYNDCQLLIIHFLSPIKLYVLKNKPAHVKVLWSIWGSDAYDYFENQYFFEPLTNNIRRRSLVKYFRFTYLYVLYHLARYRVKPLRNELNTLKLVDYVATVLPYEFNYIKKEFSLTAKYIEFNYGVNKFKSHSTIPLGGSILIGNSATFSNNHLDVFDIIKNTSCKIVVPLSYGAYDYVDYQKKIIYEGNKIFNDNFFPIVNFLSIQSYNKILISCNTIIMYHIRQQALGNIYMALYLGMRVFLNKKSITYKFMKDIGMIIFELENNSDLVGVELNENQKDINRKLVTKLQGEKAILRKIKGIIDLHHSLINNL